MLREFRFLAPHLRPYRSGYVVGALLVLASVALKVWIPRILGQSIDGLDPTRLEAAGGVARYVAERAALIVGLALAVACVRTVSRLVILGNCRKIVRDLRDQVFAKLVSLDHGFFVRTPTGTIMSRAINDMNNVQGLTGPVFMYIAETAALYAACIGLMWTASPRLTLVGLAPFPLFLVATRRLAGRIHESSRAAQQKLAEISTKVDESLSGQEVIKTSALEDVDFARFAEHCAGYRDLNLSVAAARALLFPTMLALASLSTVVVLVVGGPQVVRGEMSVGTFLAMILYLQMMAAPTGTLGFVISSLQRGAAALARIREIFEVRPAIVDRGLAGEVSAGALSVRDLTIDLAPESELSRLSDEEDEERRPLSGGRTLLRQVSFDVPAGTTLGIVGPTGSGKTTLVRALVRQIDIEPGKVFVDGQDITSLSLAGVRRAIGYVPQETFLFGDTLHANVALGRPEAEREEVERAAEIAQLSNDLPQIPGGFDAILGERGVNLSGGQRQRTALARAALVEPKILILDDALSAVDAHTADEILARLQPLLKSRTTILVAHRIATVMGADQIIVLDEGRVVERGRHDQLLAAQGLYAQLYAKQKAREALVDAAGDGRAVGGADASEVGS